MGELDGGTLCAPRSTAPCYAGPSGTESVGICRAGTKSCNDDGAAYGPCTGEVLPGAETCTTAVDDDCDGQVNEEGMGCVCVPGSSAPCFTGPAGAVDVGVCRAGTMTCSALGTGYGACTGEVLPSPETCTTAVDDDCDGQMNEEGMGCTCVPGSSSACFTGPAGTADVGICRSGTMACNALGTGFEACTGEVLPALETCGTAVDDDCDGQVNEEGTGCTCLPGSSAPCFTGPAGTADVGICRPGTMACNALGTAYGACTGQVLPAVETCTTAVDDDCDGQVNEEGMGCTCLPGSSAPCFTGPAGTMGVGVCTAGTMTCNALGTGYAACTGEVLPAIETCANTVDDDCDGQVNEEGMGCVCLPGSSGPCFTGPAGTMGVGVCRAGTQMCNAQGTAFGACSGEVLPSPETCATAVDDDCDGQVNEGGTGCVCSPGSSAPCFTGAPGTVDVGVCRAGTMTCTALGTEYGACMGEVLPSPETCNTAGDDDCDGQVNEEGAGCVCSPGSSAPCFTGPPGTADVGSCRPGTMACNALGTDYGACMGEVLPSPETCSTTADDDCDGQVNEEGMGCACLPNSSAACFTGPAGAAGVGVCRAGTMTCDAFGTAYGACTGEVLPSAESCGNTADEDCDGQVNEEGMDCVCLPGSTVSCYSGPAGTAGVGACRGGTRTCNAQGTALGPCTGEVLPATETCAFPTDEDCDGVANEGCSALTCSFLVENFDDGIAQSVTAGQYSVAWCNAVIPLASNSPLCMSGRTTRSNGSASSPTLWVYKTQASCTSVRLTYSYYQFAFANVSVIYQQSNDTSPLCPKSGSFTTAAPSQTPLQTCTQQTVTVPFGASRGVYIRLSNNNASNNAMWVDNVQVELLGCGC